MRLSLSLCGAEALRWIPALPGYVPRGRELQRPGERDERDLRVSEAVHEDGADGEHGLGAGLLRMAGTGDGGSEKGGYRR